MPKTLKEMSDEELKERYLSLYECIFIVECFGSRDCLEFYAIENELVDRGFTFQEQLPKIVKE